MREAADAYASNEVELLKFRIHRALKYLNAVRNSSSTSEDPLDVFDRILTAKPDVGDGMDADPRAMADVARGSRISCDLCGRPSGEGLWTSAEKAQYETPMTRVMLSTTTPLYDGGDITETSFNICPDCFVSKLVPWFRSQGAEPTIRGNN